VRCREHARRLLLLTRAEKGTRLPNAPRAGGYPHLTDDCERFDPAAFMGVECRQAYGGAASDAGLARQSPDSMNKLSTYQWPMPSGERT
jgi:hypothetical protein